MGTAGLARLGHYIVGRRVTLGYKQRIDFANAIAITDRTLSDIEKGLRHASAGTYAILENALEWKSGSIAAIINGGEPTAYKSTHSREAQRLRDVPTSELIDQIRVLFHELRRRLPTDVVANEPQDWPQGFFDGVAGESTSVQDGDDRDQLRG